MRTSVADGFIGHRQDPRSDAHRSGELERDLGRSSTCAQPVRPPDVGREVLVAEPEPFPFAEPLEPVHHGPALAIDTPTSDLVVESGQRVGDRVVIGPDREPMELEVVAGVDHDGEVATDL